MGHAANLFHRDGTSAFLNHVRERASGNQCVDQFAIQSISEFAQLSERDAILRFGLFGLVQRRPRDAQPLSLLTFRPAQGLSDELQPSP